MANERNMVEVVERGIQAELNRAKAEIMLKLEKQILAELHERIGLIVLKTEQFYSVTRSGHDVVITLIDQAKDRD